MCIQQLYLLDERYTPHCKERNQMRAGVSLKIEIEGGNEKVEGGTGGLAYCYIMFKMQK